MEAEALFKDIPTYCRFIEASQILLAHALKNKP